MGTDSRYKILLADDEPHNIRNLFEALNPDLYRVFVASDGKASVEQALKYLPNAIIMDWDMPEMDGIAAIKTIRTIDEIKSIPIIVATGKMTSVANLRTALEIGANDYIRKPYDSIEIEARVKSMIRLNEEQHKTIALEKEIAEKKLVEAQREIEINIQALTVSKLRLINNSKNTEALINELQSIRASVDENADEALFKIISSLKANISSINWNEIEVHFTKVYPSFYKNLHKRFQSLSNIECELCAFIKLGMTPQEIIAITCKNDNALKKARQRLKKKFGLLPADSLHSFIREFE